MKISQRVYFEISSETVSAETVTASLGMEPDELRIRGTKRAEPPIPPRHSWSVHCRDHGLRIDAQVETILDRIESIRTRLVLMAATQDVQVRLVIVRHFDDDHGEEEAFDVAITEDGKLLEKLPGQHQLLGWYLSDEQLGFLAEIRCAIWADEYA